MLTNYDVTAIIATCALLLSLAFWITLKKKWLPSLKNDIIKEAPEIGKRTYDLIKQDLPDVKELFKNELPGVITAFKKDLPDVKELFKNELPGVITAFKKELPLMMKEQAPKLIETFLEDFTTRINDPKEEQLADVMCAVADNTFAVFRVRMKDPVFNKEVNDFINGKMSLLGSYLEKHMPEILVKATPEIKKALMGGAPGEGGDPTLGLIGMFIPPEFRKMLGGGK